MRSHMKEYKQFEDIYGCECDNEFLRVLKFTEESQIYIGKYTQCHCELSFFERIKLAFNYVINPEKFDIHGDVILSKDTARKLGEDLTKITSEKPANMEFGKIGRVEDKEKLHESEEKKGGTNLKPVGKRPNPPKGSE